MLSEHAPPQRRGPLPLLSDLAGSAALAGYCLRHLAVLRTAPYRLRFLRLFVDATRSGMGDLGWRLALVGSVLVMVLFKSLALNAELLARALSLVVREIGPLLAALVVLVRAGTVLALQLCMMHQDGEVRSLPLLGLSPRQYLAVPALCAIGLATLVLTAYFQLAAAGGGLLASGLLLGFSVREMVGYLSLMVTPFDLGYAMLKAGLFGLVIGAVNAYHGLATGARGRDGLTEATARTIMQCLLLILLLNAVLAYLAYGAQLAPSPAA